MFKRLLSLASIFVVAGLLAACTPNSGPQDDINLFFGNAAGQATKIAQCESGMNPGARSPGGGNHGLFQINNVHRSSFQSVTGQSWNRVYDSYWNTMFAKWLFDRQGWGPWACKKVL